MKPTTKTIFAIVIFSIAMAALESSVVVYLRALYYAEGFTVAFKFIDKQILLVEIIREVATLIMLAAIGYLAGKTIYERFAFFLLSFAVWDIFYYVWLKIFIDWPSSFFEWDILFLIPITWLGPVLAPVICSVTMIILAIIILRASDNVMIPPTSRWMLITGSAIILYTYLYDYGNLVVQHELISDYLNLLQNEKFLKLASAYYPQQYSWGLFWLGEVVIGIGILLIYRASAPRIIN